MATFTSSLAQLVSQFETSDPEQKKALVPEIKDCVTKIGVTNDPDTVTLFRKLISLNDKEQAPRPLGGLAMKLALMLPNQVQGQQNANSMVAWLPPDSERADLGMACKPPLGPDEFASTTANSTRYIVCGGGVGGCLFVAAYSNGLKTAFLAHITPDELAGAPQKWIDRITEAVGTAPTAISFGTRVLTVDYVTKFEQALLLKVQGGLQIQKHNTGTFAINAKTGQTMYNIDPQELKQDLNNRVGK